MRLIDADNLKRYYWWSKREQRIFERLVDEQPTIEAVPVVKGIWLRIHSPSILYNHYMCSVCGEASYKKRPFCPNCGAKMRGEKND